MLWGLIGQGCICAVCNFVVHDRCLKVVVSPCSTVASNVIKNPVPHCWTDCMHLKRKFCSVCRRRIDQEANAVRCEVCEYCVHLECQDFSVTNCKECATYVPNQDEANVVQYHHWREGNLPSNSKCHACKKTCWSAECLAGMRCEWCGWTVSISCSKDGKAFFYTKSLMHAIFFAADRLIRAVSRTCRKSVRSVTCRASCCHPIV